MDLSADQQHDETTSSDKLTQKERERQAHRDLDTTTSKAIEQALTLAAQIADDPRQFGRGLAIDVALASRSEAQFIRKRINDAFSVGEWLPEVQVLLWDYDEQLDEAMTAGGEDAGFELRVIAGTTNT